MAVMRLYLLSFINDEATVAALGRNMHQEPTVHSTLILKASVEVDSMDGSGKNMGWLENCLNQI